MAILKSFENVLTHPLNKNRFFSTFITILWWKFNQIFLKIPAVVEIAPGIKILCYPNNSYGSYIVYARWPEYAELRFIQEVLNSKSIYIDVGAHIGDSSLLAASKILQGKIFSIEPTPSIFQELLTNIKLNSLEKRISPIQAAVSHTQGSAFFNIEDTAETNHLSKKKTRKSIKVTTITIDSLIKQYKLKKVTLLKIDVEGYELEVLQGSSKAIKSQAIERILFEVNPSSEKILNKIMQIEKILIKYYSFYAFTKEGKLYQVPHLTVPHQTGNFLAILNSKNVKIPNF